MLKALTKDTVLRRLASRGITIVAEYLSGKAKTRFQCKEGHAWDAQPRNGMHGTGCPHCSGTLRLTRELVNERLVGRELTMTGPYVNALIKTKFTCSEGHSWEATSLNVMRGTGRKSRLPRVTDKKRIKNSAQWELPL
jgi:hypothetical protein